MERSIYMTTGEFAKMVGVTKDTLFHYDDINLFSPEIVGENGYRYYSINQAETLDTILILKDLGMPLKEIREFIKNRNADRYYLFRKVFGDFEKEFYKKMSELVYEFQTTGAKCNYEVAYIQYGRGNTTRSWLSFPYP